MNLSPWKRPFRHPGWLHAHLLDTAASCFGGRGRIRKTSEEAHDRHDGVVRLAERNAAAAQIAQVRGANATGSAVGCRCVFEVLVFNFELKELEHALFAGARADVLSH
jgi:hypothetical protein